MKMISDQLLLDYYVKAKELGIDNDFISLLIKEIERRKIFLKS